MYFISIAIRRNSTLFRCQIPSRDILRRDLQIVDSTLHSRQNLLTGVRLRIIFLF